MASIFDSLIQQESGGRPGVRGPKTKYGSALGLTQLLPGTAQEMAGKLGVPWQPEMLTAKHPQGAAYQRQLGEAYYNEGLQKTGNERDALRYYHGGPNREQWGPKTNAYADQVLARAGGNAMIQPRKPKPGTLGAMVNNAPLMDEPMAMQGSQPMAPPPQQFAEAPQIDPPKPNNTGKTLGSILGILGDSLAAYGGQRGVFAPFMQQQQQDEREDNRYQQQLAAKVAADREARMAKANEPPQWLQDAQTFQSLPQDQRQSVISYRDAMYPVIADVQGADGSVVRQQMPRSLGAPKPGAVEDGYMFMGGDPKDQNNWRPQ